MGANIKHRRIRRAFEKHEASEPSHIIPDRGIGRLPKKKSEVADGRSPRGRSHGPGTGSPRPPEKRGAIHPIEAKLQRDGALILKALERHGGYLPLGDHSRPEVIRSEFQLSKHAFKQAIGHLWKQRKIEIRANDGIRLRQESKGAMGSGQKSFTRSPRNQLRKK